MRKVWIDRCAKGPGDRHESTPAAWFHRKGLATMTRQQQIAAKTPPLLSGIAETVDEPEFRHFVDADYPEELEASPSDMDDIRRFGGALVTVAAFVGIMLAVAFIFIPMGAHVLRSVLP